MPSKKEKQKISILTQINNNTNKHYNKIIVGLDISSTVIGYTIMSADEELIMCKAISINVSGIINKFDAINDELIPLLINDISSVDYDDVEFIVEEYNLAFSKSQIKTIVVLYTVNNYIRYKLYKQYNKECNTIYAVSARSKLKIKKPEKDFHKKSNVYIFVYNKYMDSFSEFDELSEKQKEKQGLFDITDSVILTLSFLYGTKQ